MSKPIGLPKTGGRKKGTPNRRTLVVKSVAEALGLDVPARLVEILPKLHPDKQADVLLELMGYLFPKRKAIDVKMEDFNHNRETLALDISNGGEREI